MGHFAQTYLHCGSHAQRLRDPRGGGGGGVFVEDWSCDRDVRTDIMISAEDGLGLFLLGVRANEIADGLIPLVTIRKQDLTECGGFLFGRAPGAVTRAE